MYPEAFTNLDEGTLFLVINKYAFLKASSKSKPYTDIQNLLIISETYKKCSLAILNLYNHLHTSPNLHFWPN